MGKQKDKKKLIETHGKVEELQPTRIEQIWGGFNEMSKYGTLQESEYESQLNEMNRTDMETHARRLGVVILESTARLKDSLIKEFRVYISTLHRPAVTTSSVVTKPIKVDAETRKILSEGR